MDMEDYKVLPVDDVTYHIKYCFRIKNTAFKTVQKHRFNAIPEIPIH